MVTGDRIAVPPGSVPPSGPAGTGGQPGGLGIVGGLTGVAGRFSPGAEALAVRGTARQKKCQKM
jgi:hypothetical protein